MSSWNLLFRRKRDRLSDFLGDCLYHGQFPMRIDIPTITKIAGAGGNVRDKIRARYFHVLVDRNKDCVWIWPFLGLRRLCPDPETRAWQSYGVNVVRY